MTVAVVHISQMPTDFRSSLDAGPMPRGKWIVEKPECGSQEEQNTPGLWELVINRDIILKK